MSDYLERACRHFDIEPGRVTKYRQLDDEIVILADYGIGGIKKYRVPLSQLPEPEPAQTSPPEPVPEKETPDPLSAYDYRDLQTLAKAEGIAANQSKDALIAALGYSFGEEE